MARNPLDAAVSYYHLHRSIRIMDYVGTFEKFWEYFKKDLSKQSLAIKARITRSGFSFVEPLLVTHQRRMGAKARKEPEVFVL